MGKSEFYNKLKVFENRYLSDVIYKIYNAHKELQEEINILVEQAVQNKEYDKSNGLLEDAGLPMYPEHYTLKDFDVNCLSPQDKESYEQIISCSLLEVRDHPNLIIYGPPNQGKEKLVIGLGDHFCKNRHSVKYIDFHKLLKVISTHEAIPESNTTYEDLEKVECLIIHDFAGQNIYDPDLLDALNYLLQQRADKQIAKHNSRWKPHVTYVDTCYPPNSWIKHFTADEMKVCDIVNKLYGMGLTITVDETNKEKDNSKKGGENK